MLQGSCDACKWMETVDVAGPVEIGNRPMLCKRFPPTPVALNFGRGVQMTSQWPPVAKGITCGEFAPTAITESPTE